MARGINVRLATPAPSRGSKEVTDLLLDWQAGKSGALNRLISVVYDDLHRLAQARLAREHPHHSLQPTALVHEVYLKLVDQKRARWHSRTQFFAIAAGLIRRVLVDHARNRRAAKRGGGTVLLPIDEVSCLPDQREIDLVELEQALTALASFAPRQSRTIELRYFGGLTIEETAEIIGVSPATVKLDWRMAKAWLFRELRR